MMGKLQQHWHKRRSQKGILLIEIVLAVAVFGMLSLVVLSAFVYGREATSVAGDNSRAAQVANTTVEALRNLAQSSFTNLNGYTNGTSYYLSSSGNTWSISGSPTTLNGIYTPKIVFSAGPNGSRQADITVTWKETRQRQGSFTTTTYLTNWQTATTQTIKTGLLVYANGGTSANNVSYKLLQSNGLWTSAGSIPTAGNGNSVARSAKMYPAQTGNSKMLLVRYGDGTNQFIYATLWNGSAWGTPFKLTQWQSNSGLDSGNFSGTYMANGKFIAAYSDDTNQPKYRVYDGTTWGAQASIGTMTGGSGDSPTSMIIQARPGSNEAMVAMLGEGFETLTAYYANNTWSAFTVQASNGTSNGTHNVDFAWSKGGSSNHGALVFTSGSADRTPSVRIFTANGSGGGSWGSTMTSTNQPTGSIVISVAVAGQPSGGENFMVCDKDDAATQKIYCYTATPTSISNPTNPILAATTAAGGAQTMELGYEDLIGTTGLAAYADGSTAGKLKRFLSGTNTWDANPVSTPVASAAIVKTKIIPEPGQNDAMVLVIDNNNNLYTNMYNGNSNIFYTQPAGYNWTIHNANGPSTNAKWFDFAWDNQ